MQFGQDWLFLLKWYFIKHKHKNLYFDMITVTATKLVVCVGEVSFPFPGGEIEKARSERGTHLGWKKMRASGKKMNCLQWIPNILLNCVCQWTGSNSAIWLVSSPSNKKRHKTFDSWCIIWHLADDKIKAWSEEAFAFLFRNIERPFWSACHWQIMILCSYFCPINVNY